MSSHTLNEETTEGALSPGCGCAQKSELGRAKLFLPFEIFISPKLFDKNNCGSSMPGLWGIFLMNNQCVKISRIAVVDIKLWMKEDYNLHTNHL